MEKISIKPPVEVRYADELALLAKYDTGKRPENWKLSPKAVRTFILGGKVKTDDGNVTVSRKFYGNDALVERCIITLAGNRGLMLVGEPGTAKTMLSGITFSRLLRNKYKYCTGYSRYYGRYD